MNDTLKTIAERYSCRSFQDKMPPDDLLNAITDAALAAPSGVNRQPWRVILVKDTALILEMEAEGMRIVSDMADKASYERIMSRGGAMYYHAPCMIMVPIASNAKPMALIDCGILCENVALAAHSLGLGSVICGMAGTALSGPKGDYFKQKLGFPEGYEFGISVLLGYAEKVAAPHALDISKLSVITAGGK